MTDNPNDPPPSGENINLGVTVTNGARYRDRVTGKMFWRWTARVIALHDGYAWLQPLTGGFVDEGPLTHRVSDLFNIDKVTTTHVL